MKTKISGIQFTTRFWLQSKIRKFIKELDYDTAIFKLQCRTERMEDE